MKNWGKTVAIPVDVLNFLIFAEATRSAHDELCDPGTRTYHISKVDDTLGIFLSWLWDSDKKSVVQYWHQIFFIKYKLKLFLDATREKD